jgi:hypothetical protein
MLFGRLFFSPTLLPSMHSMVETKTYPENIYMEK